MQGGGGISSLSETPLKRYPFIHMKLDQPLGHSAWAGTVMRLALGFYLLSKGLDELPKPIAEIHSLGPIKEIPQHVSRLIGTLLPYFEVVSGGLLILGFWTTLGAILATIASAVLIAISGTFPPAPQAHIPNKELLILAASISMLYLGGGFVSVDKFRSGSGGA
jgi:uncharacterized membrane protein YphA (DoxX/SURF4 family)